MNHWNPIIPGFFPDPTICRVGENYYVANSSFEYFPGVPIHHSNDLVDWSQIGNILDRRSQFQRGSDIASTGIFAGTLRHHKDRFWFVTTNVNTFESGQLIVSADRADGPWSNPTFVSQAIGIDPDICWDEDGTCYLTWKRLEPEEGNSGIYQAPLDPNTGQLLETPYPVWQGTGLSAEEGPHLYHRGAYWYILLAEGGTDRNHCVTVARGRSPRGPFSPNPNNPILTHRNSPHPVQSTGHADLIELSDGSWAAVFLGTRPQGSAPGFHLLGRETFLAGIDWVDGWPVFVEERFEVPPSETAFHDEMTAELHPRWIAPDGEPGQFVFATDGRKAAKASSTSWPVCFRVRDHNWVTEIVVEGEGSGFIRIDQRHECGITLRDNTVTASASIGDVRSNVASVRVHEGPVTLRLIASATPRPILPVAFPPDVITLECAQNGASTQLAQLDGRYFSTEVATGFTGRVIALYPITGKGRYLSVHYQPEQILEK